MNTRLKKKVKKVPESWDEYCYRQEKMLNSLPRCCWCGEPIQDEYMYDFGDGYVCENCKEEHLKDIRKNVDDYLEEAKGEW